MMVIERMSIQEYEVLMASRRQSTPEDTHEADPGPESNLKSRIRAHAKDQGWPVLVFPESREVIRFLPPGWPDITIKLPFAHTLDIETKSYTGKLRKEQKDNQLIWMHLGHTIHEVRSFKRFLQIVEGILRRE